jgi:MFS family permease
MMQFYFLGSARFMTDRGIPGRAVPGAMATAQAAQSIATLFVLGPMLGAIGFHWTLTAGIGCWLLLYVVYVALAPRVLLVAAQALHGLAYVLFMIVGQIYAERVATPDIRSSMQALVFAATTGLGFFLGTQAAGAAMDHFSAAGSFQWRKIWLLPLVVMIVGGLVFAVGFHNPPR